MGKFRKALNAVIGIGILSGMSYCTYNFATAESRVRALCNEIQPGMAVTQLKEFVEEHGLGPQPKESGLSYVVETKTYGRFGCKIITESGIVKGAEYNFAD